MASNTYTVVREIPGYFTSVDAKNKRMQKSIVRPNTYYVQKESNGMINLSSVQGVSGTWINPSDNMKLSLDSIVSKSKSLVDNILDQAQDLAINATMSAVNSALSTASSYLTSVSPTLDLSSGNNKRVYRPTKEYIPCYVINLVTGQTIEFDCEPEEINDMNSAQFDSQEIRGRSSPYQGYNTSGPRTISLELMLHDDLCKEGLLNTVNHLKSLTYPGYEGVLVPPSCLVRIGDMIHAKAITNDVGVVWQKPYRNGIYLLATVSLNFTETPDTPFSSSEIWEKGGYL